MVVVTPNRIADRTCLGIAMIVLAVAISCWALGAVVVAVLAAAVAVGMFANSLIYGKWFNR